jgi:3alpha(or 20beta)-hydroxysteroid dehydrogenase
MPGRVAGKVAVVTGAANGQGAAEAAALAAEGATVIATDIVEPVGVLPENVSFRKLDVGSKDDWVELAEHIRATHGRLDVLVNNAGMTGRSQIADVDLELWNRVFTVNVTGPMLGMQTLMPLMGRGSSVINTSSEAGLTGHWPVAYTASKWALRGLARVANNELGRLGIRVNTIFPGYIQTQMVAKSGPEFIDLSLAEIPLGRLGTVDDVAPLVVFLASDESSYISGVEIPVDGGQWSHGGTKRFLDAAVANPSAWGALAKE